MRPQVKSQINSFSTAGSNPSQSQSRSSAENEMPSAGLSTEFSSLFGTTAAGTGTDAVSQIFAAGGFHNRKRKLQYVTLGIAMAAIIGVAIFVMQPRDPGATVPDANPTMEVTNVASDVPEPIADELVDDPELIYAEALQEDLAMNCTVLEEKASSGLVRYGCNAVLQTGEYYGVVLGWWKAIDSVGKRVPITELAFRDEGFDTTFAVRARQSQAQVKLVPWRR